MKVINLIYLTILYINAVLLMCHLPWHQIQFYSKLFTTFALFGKDPNSIIVSWILNFFIFKLLLLFVPGSKQELTPLSINLQSTKDPNIVIYRWLHPAEHKLMGSSGSSGVSSWWLTTDNCSRTCLGWAIVFFQLVVDYSTVFRGVCHNRIVHKMFENFYIGLLLLLAMQPLNNIKHSWLEH